MRAELEQVAGAGDSDRAIIRLERPLLDRLIGDYDLVDLVERKARDINRRFAKQVQVVTSLAYRADDQSLRK